MPVPLVSRSRWDSRQRSPAQPFPYRIASFWTSLVITAFSSEAVHPLWWDMSIGTQHLLRCLSSLFALGREVLLLRCTSFSWYSVKLAREQGESRSALMKTSTLSSSHVVQHEAGAVSRGSFSCNLPREFPPFGCWWERTVTGTLLWDIS